MKADGSVIIDTKISTGGMEQGFERIKNGMDSVADTAQKTGNEINNSFAKFDASKTIANATAKVKALQSELAEVNRSLDYAADAGQTETNSESVARLVAQQEQLYERLEAARTRLANEVSLAAQKQAAAEEREAKRAADKVKREAEKKAAAEEQAAQRSIKAAEKEAAATAKAAEKEAKAREKAAKRAAAAATKPAVQFGNRLRGILSGALIFNAVGLAVRNIVSYFNQALNTNEEYRESLARLKAAFLTAIQPIYEYVLPAVIDLMNWLTNAITVIGQFFAALTGKSYSEMKKNAEALYEQTSAIEDVGNASEEASKQLMGFDEINRLSNPSAENTSTATSNASSGLGEDTVAPDFASFDISEYKAKLDELTTYVSMSLLALGAILAFSGANIPLGIGLMALGAVGLANEIATNWEGVKQALEGPVGDVIMLVSGALLALGAILAFSGANIPLGIGLMLAGAVGLAPTVAAKWNSIEKELKGPVGKVVALVSGALLALGAILAFSGTNIPLGIGLMLAGAAGLATTTAVNWDSIKSAMQGPLGELVALISGALLVLGAILAFTGAGIPLGIGLMVAGAVGLATTAAINWDSIKQKIQSVISGILAILSGAALVLGVLMCLSGAGLGIGLALIAAGIAGSVVAWNLDDNPVTRFVKNLANGVIKMVNWIIDAVNDLFHIKFNGLNIGGVQIIPKIDTRLLNIPKIPLLAQGAVIPPNAPFMAMLGDQRNGTNIEAPLSTIQEALRNELGGSGMLAALQEQNELLRQILENSGVYLDGQLISDTVSRYQRRRARAGGY